MHGQTPLHAAVIVRGELDRLPGFKNILGKSSKLIRTLEMAARVAERDSPVLLIGEPGTGKDLLAAAIHANSPHRDLPLISVNCSDLHGPERQPELFPLRPGTVVFNEIEKLPSSQQLKLMQAMEYGEEHSAQARARIIAATHRDLRLSVKSGIFREDLFYRLSVVPLELPPLRERKDDLPDLVQHLFGKLTVRHHIKVQRISATLIDSLAQYQWPGNIRELQNVVERMLLLCAGDELTREDLPHEIRERRSYSSALGDLPEAGVSLSGVERDLLLKALERFNGNQSKAARYLQISRRTLIYRMEKYKLRGAPRSSEVPR
jgi:DNA-binding NtrC family response regulator